MYRESFNLLKTPFKSGLPEACLLDRLADAELQMGHVAQAERLAAKAAELREVVR